MRLTISSNNKTGVDICLLLIVPYIHRLGLRLVPNIGIIDVNGNINRHAHNRVMQIYSYVMWLENFVVFIVACKMQGWCESIIVSFQSLFGWVFEGSIPTYILLYIYHNR